jgi:thiol-disulfide isomerase/thioredoxin
MKYLVLLVLTVVIALFLVSNKTGVPVPELLRSLPARAGALIDRERKDAARVPDEGARSSHEAQQTPYFKITLKSGASVSGRAENDSPDGSLRLVLPYGAITISEEDIAEKIPLVGEDAVVIEATLDQAAQFAGTGKTHAPILEGGDSQEKSAGESEAATEIAAAVEPEAHFNRPISWKRSFETGASLAKQQNKNVMIDFYTSWCGWCTKLDEETFRDPKVRAWVNKHFIAVKIDGDKDKVLQPKYGVRGYPNIVFTDADGTKLHQVGGYLPAEPFLAELKKIKHTS